MLAGWPHLEEYKTQLYSFCEEALKELDNLRKEAREERESGVEEKKLVKIRIKLPQVPPSTIPLKTKRDESCGESSSVGERPQKKHCGDF